MSPTTKFRMASHSKLFTAVAIMQLREQGKLRLDDPVSTYLPWFKAKPAGEDDGPITVARSDEPHELARAGLLELGYEPGEADRLLSGAAGETAEEILASALRGARA